MIINKSLITLLHKQSILYPLTDKKSGKKRGINVKK